MAGLVDGKVALVTGAGGGIGRAVALVLGREGARVVLAGRKMAPLEQTLGLLRSAGGEGLCVETDVSRGEEVHALVAAAVDRYGRVDCAVNNAGIDGPLAPTADYDEAAFDEVIAVNLKGVWNCLRYEIPAMLAQGGGSIVNVSSALGEAAQYNMPAYTASKYGVIGLTRAAALDYATRNLRVNALLPGVTETPMMTQQMERMPGFRDVLVGCEPIGRLGRPEEIAEAAAWLCSDRASFCLGAAMVVDGGYLIR
jgi:NAD(P)-dependent dehydrogenase (short-subunit alcohol dehydrogenase family)